MKNQRIIKESGRTRVTSAPSASSATLSLDVSPVSFGGRLDSMADLFLEYRFTKLNILAYYTLAAPAANGATVINNPEVTVCYQPVKLNTAPSTHQQLIDFQAANIGLGPQRLKVSRNILIDQVPVKWFLTRATASAPADLEVQGMISYKVTDPDTTTGVFNRLIVVEWQIEFRGEVNASVSKETHHAMLRMSGRLPGLPRLVEDDTDTKEDDFQEGRLTARELELCREMARVKANSKPK